MPVITLTTDFGFWDPFVGIMKGVILSRAPEVNIIDLNHGVGAGDILAGGFSLAHSLQFFPPGTIHVVVVDPGVGGSRRAMAMALGNQYFLAPDNGILSLAMEKLGGPFQAYELRDRGYFLQPVSSTFHGRDIFAPAAAELARGRSLVHLGDPIDDPLRLSLTTPVVTERGWRGGIIAVDHFGNLVTNILSREVGEIPLVVRAGGETIYGPHRSYGEGKPFAVVFASHGYLEIALKNGNAADNLGLGVGGVVDVEKS